MFDDNDPHPATEAEVEEIIEEELDDEPPMRAPWLGEGVNDLGAGPTDEDIAEARRKAREAAARLVGTDRLIDPPERTTVFIVSDFGTIELLRDTIAGLPQIGFTATVEAVDFVEYEAKVTIHGDPGFLKFAFERQGYAKIIRIAEPHGPATGEIPVTRTED